MKRNFISILLLFILFTTARSQFTVSGKLVDRSNHDPVPFAHIIGNDGSNGTITDTAGVFSIKVKNRKGVIRIQTVGYESSTVLYKIQNKTQSLGIVYLDPKSYKLDEITITAGLAKRDESPVTVSEVDSRNLQNRLGDQPVAMSMHSIPGVYTVRDGGGSGDAEMSIRGFHQENVAILLNGVPYNGVENGLVYWSNWLGLNNSIAMMQVQKGPGLANAAINAVGGSVNIVTKPASNKKGGTIGYRMTDYGNREMFVALNSGSIENDWSVSFIGSHITGPGYIDATRVKGYSYFLALEKKLNDKNRISLSLIGSPNRHGQRTLRLSNEEMEDNGYLFNKDWGSYKGDVKNASENFYHKPFLGVNHYLTIDENKKLANSFYVSYGTGGGKWSESFNYSPSIFQYRDPAGQIDWETIYDNNLNHEDHYILADGTIATDYSMNVLTHFLASHIQTGIMSTYEQNFNNRFKLTAGIHYRYFNSFLREKITDLFGGEYFIEDYGWAVDGVAGRDQIKTTGDLIKVDNNSITNFINTYAQLIYNNDNINAYFSVNGNNNWYQRVDRYNYISDNKSEVLVKPGYDTRVGISYKPDEKNLFYLNGAYLSKAPYYKYAFGNFTNVPVKNLENEIIETVDLGYRFKTPALEAEINTYYTFRGNVSLLSNEYIQLENNTQTRAMINGLEALHMGVEGEIKTRFGNNLMLGGFLSVGDFKWRNNVNAKLFNNNNVVVDTVNIFAEGLYVGGTAQQQYGLLADLKLVKFFNLGAEWMFYNKLYANFNPNSRNDPDDHEQPFEIPPYNILNVHVNIPFEILSSNALLQLNAFNLLDNIHIVKGEDGTDHDLDTFNGFWSFGRTFNFTVKVNF